MFFSKQFDISNPRRRTNRLLPNRAEKSQTVWRFAIDGDREAAKRSGS
jgi:hypothetical protein